MTNRWTSHYHPAAWIWFAFRWPFRVSSSREWVVLTINFFCYWVDQINQISMFSTGDLLRLSNFDLIGFWVFPIFFRCIHTNMFFSLRLSESNLDSLGVGFLVRQHLRPWRDTSPPWRTSSATSHWHTYKAVALARLWTRWRSGGGKTPPREMQKKCGTERWGKLT